MANGRTLEQAEKQIALLVAENRRLAGELDALQKQSAVLENAARDARAAQAAAEKDTTSLKSTLDASTKELAQTRDANKVLTAQVGRLNKQVDKQPLNPLTIEEGSQLFDRVIGAFRGTRGLEVKQASLNLKLATAKLGDNAVLLLPDPKSVDPATLHELKLDLITTPRLEETTRPAPPPLPRPVPAPLPSPLVTPAARAAARKVKRTPSKKRR